MRRLGAVACLLTAVVSGGCVAPLDPACHGRHASLLPTPVDACGDCVGAETDPWAVDGVPVDPHWEKCKRHLKRALRPDLGYELPPAVPLSVGPSGRFFPVPVRPALAPRDAGPAAYGVAPPETAALGGGPRL